MTGFQEQVFEEKDFTKDMFSSFADELTPVMAAHLCDMAYYEASEIKRTLEKVKLYRQFDYFEGEAVFYFIVETVHYVAMIFRGTFNKLGWMTNIDIRARHTIFGPIHNGFAQDFVDIQNSLFKSKISLYKRRRIFIAEHSKGGDLTNLCAIFLIENGFSRTSIYTFGSPTAFCATFPFENTKKLLLLIIAGEEILFVTFHLT